MGSKKGMRELAQFFNLITNNFSVFTSEIIGLDNAQFHKEIDDQISNSIYKKLCIAVSRGHGKSTHLSVAYPLWELARNHNIRILLVSSTSHVTRSFLREITAHIEGNEKYQVWSRGIDPTGKGITPKLKAHQKREAQWTGDSITIQRTDLKIKDPTISAVGLFGSILSKRADIIIVDDLVNQENSATEEQRQKIKDWVYTTLIPVLVPGGRFIYLGNTWHMDDLVSNLLKDPQFDIKKRIPAILHEAHNQELWQQWANIHLDESLNTETKKEKASAFYNEHKEEMDAGVEVLWPKRFPYSDLYLARLSNPYSFARMYQCDPSIRPNQKFQESDIELALRKGRDFVLQDAERTEYETEYTVSGLDLAISLKDTADDTVLLSIDKVKYGRGEIKNGDYVIRNIERNKLLPKDVLDMVIRHDQIVKPNGIRVESVGYQESMSRDLADYSIPVRSYHTGSEKNDPDIGVNSLAIILAQGKLVFPNSNKDSRTRLLINKLVNEMRAYPDGHTGDSLMALWFAYSEMRDYTANKIIIPLPESPKSLPTQKELEKEADQEIILDQAIKNGDPAAKIKASVLKSQKESRNYWVQEERDRFNGLMGGL